MLTDEAVVEIRERYQDGAKQHELAKMFGISRRYVGRLALGQSRPGAGGPISGVRCRQGWSLEESHRSRVKMGAASDCWPWTGATIAAGYGVLRRDLVLLYAHRVAWELAERREIPEGMVVRHMCHNRVCCNPAHLEIGTHADNVADSMADGRIRIGEDHGMAKLSECDVRAIIAKLDRGETQVDLSRQYGVTAGAIGEIARGRNWKHIPRPHSARLDPTQ